MGINVRKDSDRTVISTETLSLVGDTAKELKEKANKILDDGERNIALDLYSTNFIDSSGVGKLLFLSKKLENLGGKFEIIRINGELYSFLDSLAITKVIKVAKPE